MPANDGPRPHIDHRIAPIEELRKQREAHTSRMVHSSGFDTALDIPRELFAKNQILSADRIGRAQEQDDQSQDVRDDSNDCSPQLQHVLIMPESAPAFAGTGHEGDSGANYCGPQAALPATWCEI